jgi:hypothetical protein
MKQITLETQSRLVTPCAGRLLAVWALYGWSMTLVWYALSRGPFGATAAWLFALISGLALAVWMREV